MVGLGSQDSLALAESFVADTGAESMLMVWDESFESWLFYGVRGQPTAILVAPDGTAIAAWQGLFPEDEVLELAAAL